jgi:hypothetical protein
VLFIVGIASLSIRLWLLNQRWINPDEGPHLMDAVLVLDGKIPQVDFDSRELIYVYSLAGFLKLFGTSYISGRLLPLTCSLLVGLVIFRLAATLFDRKVALLSTVMYWMFPLEISQSVIVKTEPLVSLLTALAFYGAARFSLTGRPSWLAMAAMFAALGFYARQSAVIIPVVVSVFIVLFHWTRAREVALRLGIFFAGYCAVILCVLGYYVRFVSPGDLWGFIPIGWAVGRVVSPGRWGWSSQAIDPLSAHHATVSLGLSYWEYVHQALYFSCFLIVGLVFSILEQGYPVLGQQKPAERRSRVSASLLYLWLFFLFGAYAFYFYSRGFFVDYSREFLPPLVIVLSAWLMRSVPSLRRDGALERFVLGGLCLSAGLFVIHEHYPAFFGIGQHASLAVALITVFTFAGAFANSTRRVVFILILSSGAAFIVISRMVAWKTYLSGLGPSLVMVALIYAFTWIFLKNAAGQRAPSLPEYGRFVCLSVVSAAFVVSISFSAIQLGLRYDSIWSPQSVDTISSELKALTDRADEVMSGGVIWELQASRRPFHMISHPLRFEYGMTQKERAMIDGALVTRPPKAIVVDGYTEKTYFRASQLAELVDAKYQFERAAGPAVFPVKLYRLKDGSVASQMSSPR